MKTMTSRSFLQGYVRVLDLMGVSKQWPDITNDKTKDYDALRSDWEDVGRSIQEETRNYEKTRTRNFEQ